jgi:glycosidase
MLNFLENHDEQRLASDFLLGSGEKALPALLVSSLMPSPFMLYFGQELGERGMDEEGFSGRDGRTTIFDYWSVSTIRRWRNKGRFDGKQLTEEEISLQQTYQSILQLREQEPYTSEGFYDLMYVNRHLHRQYAFVRHSGKKFSLIVANFSNQEETVSINIPKHFFEFTGIKEKGNKTFSNVLNGKKIKSSFSSTEPLVLTLPANFGVILR